MTPNETLRSGCKGQREGPCGGAGPEARGEMERGGRGVVVVLGDGGDGIGMMLG